MPGKHTPTSRKVSRCAKTVKNVRNPWAVCNAAIRGKKSRKRKSK